jgi:hypothetical protein
MLLLLALPAPSSAETRQVTRMVPGLYESVPARHALDLGRLKLRGAASRFDGSYRLDLSYTDPHGARSEGFLIRTVKRDPQTGRTTLNLGNALLKPGGKPRLPKFVNVPGTVPLVPGRGTPTVVFGTLQILRLHDVARGGLSAITSYISNGETTVELMRSPRLRMQNGRPTEGSMARVFLSTQSGRYFKTIARQSGHRITGVKVKLESMEDASVAGLRRSSPALRRLLTGFSGERIDLPLFEVELTLAPLGR